MAQFVTTEALAEVPILEALNDNQRASVLEDAATVLDYVRAHPWIDDPTLREWGEANDLEPDRLNRALAFLQETGQLARFGD